MRDEHTRPLTVCEAAKILYATQQPTSQQLRRVEQRLQGGLLKGTRSDRANGCWITTAAFIAEYLARQAYENQRGRVAPAGAAGCPARRPCSESPQVRQVYYDVLSDYFLALLFRRKNRRASRRFRRAVLAGQFFILLLMASIIVSAVCRLRAGALPEQMAVVHWLEKNVDRFDVLRWRASVPATSDGNGLVVGVEYRYAGPRGKAVETHRVFLVRGSAATPQQAED